MCRTESYQKAEAEKSGNEARADTALVLSTNIDQHNYWYILHNCLNRLRHDPTFDPFAHGHNVINGLKLLCGNAPAMSLVGVARFYS